MNYKNLERDYLYTCPKCKIPLKNPYDCPICSGKINQKNNLDITNTQDLVKLEISCLGLE